jgi:hypothetical protein
VDEEEEEDASIKENAPLCQIRGSSMLLH